MEPKPVEINILNVIEVETLDFAFWLDANCLDIRFPEYGPNYTPNPNVDLAPLLPMITNRLAIATQFYNVIVGATPTQTSLKTSDVDGGSRGFSQEMGRKKDILHSTVRCLEAQRNTCAGMLKSTSGRGYNE